MKTSILHQFTWLKASVVGILSGIEYTTVGFTSVVKINWYSVVKRRAQREMSFQLFFVQRCKETYTRHKCEIPVNNEFATIISDLRRRYQQEQKEVQMDVVRVKLPCVRWYHWCYVRSWLALQYLHIP